MTFDKRKIDTFRWKARPYIIAGLFGLCLFGSSFILASSDSLQILRTARGPKYFVGCNPQSWKFYVRPEYYYLYNGLIQDYGWESLPRKYLKYKPQDRDEMMNELIKLAPTVILFCENNVEWYPNLPIQELRKIGTKIAAFSDDLHMYNRYSTEKMREILQQTDALVGTYAYMMDQFFSSVMDAELLPSRIWLPHSASPTFTTREFNTDPIEKIFLSGATERAAYPIRHWLHDIFQPQYPAVMSVHEHPGYQKHAENQSALYAQTIRSHFASITTTMLHRRLVAKTFEIPATGSLLMVNLDLESLLLELGMKNMVHYVGFANDDPEKMIWWVMDPKNQEEVKRIRKIGRQIVLKLHKTGDRALALNRYFETNIEPYRFTPLENATPCPMIGFSSEKDCIESFYRLISTHKYHKKSKDQYIKIN